MKPIIGITMGDPAGIGPEIIIKALAVEEVKGSAKFLIYGDVNLLNSEAVKLGIDQRFVPVVNPSEATFPPNLTEVINLSLLNPSQYCRTGAICGDAAFSYVKAGATAAINGQIHAVVTAPISKESLKSAGHNYPGHTEILAELCKTEDYVMMLAGSHIKVVLCTIHVPYAQVPSLLSRELVYKTIRITHDSLSRYLGKTPRIAVAALNPHAGEGGIFGEEEERIIRPAVEDAAEKGMDVSGPYPADTLFYHLYHGRYDLAVCMYHDQGLIPMKMLDFENGVNVTLGLPIIRTSVDHGTAFNIAGKGIANPSSMIEAIKTAVKMAESNPL